MSYEKAMKHSRNVRKCKKQSAMHFGFDSNTVVQSAKGRQATVLLLNITQWFRTRHRDEAIQHTRECIREAIGEYRALFN